MRKNNWFLFGSYHSPSQSDEYFFNHVENGLGVYSKVYDKYMLIEDFNAEESEPCLSQFLFEMNAKNVVKEPTCFKSLSNPSYIDLAITNSFSSFQNKKAISTGLSDFPKMVVSVLKYNFHRSAPRELVYRDYKNFDRLILKRGLEDKPNHHINEYKHFQQIFSKILKIHAPVTSVKETFRANHVPYMTNGT